MNRLCVAFVFLFAAACEPAQEHGSDIALGRALDADLAVTDETRTFAPSDTVYASIDTKGKHPGTAVSALFSFEDGQVFQQGSMVIGSDHKGHTEFHLAKPTGLPAGSYTVEIIVGGEPVQSRTFKVK